MAVPAAPLPPTGPPAKEYQQANPDGTRSATLVGTRGPGETFTYAFFIPAGSFLYVPAGAVHFDGAVEETVLLGTAVGPWSTDYLVG